MNCCNWPFSANIPFFMTCYSESIPSIAPCGTKYHLISQDTCVYHCFSTNDEKSLRARPVSQAVVAHAFNPSIWETEASGSLSSRPAWSTEWAQDSQSYTEKPCLENNNNNNNNNKQNKHLSPAPPAIKHCLPEQTLEKCHWIREWAQWKWTWGPYVPTHM